MSIFAAAAALLVLGALAFLLPSLLAAQAADAPGAAPEYRVALALALLLPLLSAALYAAIGSPAAIFPQVAPSRSPAHAASPEQVAAMVAGLGARLKAQPDDAAGWAMLARSYAMLGRYADALVAYDQAATRLPRDAQLLADYADIAAMAQGRKLQGRPEAIIARALAADPDNLKALSLSGTLAFERGDYAGAIAQWRRILALVPPGSPVAQSVRGGIADAERRTVVGAGAAIEGRVTLAKAIAGQVGPADTVFIYAHAAEGSRMPLAMRRVLARDLPVDFRLDDTMAMNPASPLSSASRVVVVARVSRSGSAEPRPGDLGARSAPLPTSARGVALEIAGPATP